MNARFSLAIPALRSILTELVEGPAEQGAWTLGRGDAGLIGELQRIGAATASRVPAAGRKSIAAHARHVKFGLELLNRWAAGEENPFATADWEASWQQQQVSQEEWEQLVAGLRREAETWIEALQAPREWDAMSLTGSLASATHLAYHLGAIRQMVIAFGRSD